MSTPRIKEILVLHHTHTDIGYTHPQPVLWELQRRFIDQAINLAEQTADWPEPSRFRWTCECTWPLMHWLEQAPPRDVERFQKRVEAGQLGAGALPFHPAASIDATQIIRTLQPVVRLRRHLGLPLRTAIGHDVNGLPWPANGLLNDAGIELLIMGINIVFGGYPLERPMAFRWARPDGGELLVFNGEHYAAFDRELNTFEGSIDRMAEGLNAYIERTIGPDYPHDFVYLTATHPFFVDNNPPCPGTMELIHQWNAAGREPMIRTILPEQLLERLKAQRDSLPVVRGDWTDWWSFGIASSATEVRMNRQTRRRLAGASLLHANQHGEDSRVSQTLARAQYQADLWEEHTWGAAASIAMPDRDTVIEQWTHKAHMASEARSLTGMLLRDQLERLAGNEPVGAEAHGVLFFNPAPVARRTMAWLPRTWLAHYVDSGTTRTEEGRATGSLKAVWQHFSSNVMRLESDMETWGPDNAIPIGPIDLPASGYRTIPTDSLHEAGPAEGCAADGPSVQSPHYRLVFDPAACRFSSLHDRRMDRELLDANSPWSLFGYVRERPEPRAHGGRQRGREALMEFDWSVLHANIPGWKTHWHAARQGPLRLHHWRSEHTHEGASLHLSWDAPGVAWLEQSITLLAHRPAVRFEARFDLLNTVEPESVYFTFPLDLPGWRAHYDTADLPVAYDTEQLPGTARDFLTAGQWVCVHNASLAALLVCPDAPMVQIGDFNFGRRIAGPDPQRPPLLLGWPANNYWMTNFRASQPGVIRVCYELSTMPQYDAAACTRAAMAASQPVEVHPMLQCEDDTAQSLIEIDHPALYLLHAEEAEAGMVLRIANVTDEPAAATLKVTDRTIAAAAVTDPFAERKQRDAAVTAGTARLSLPPRHVSTVRLHLSPA